MAFKRFKRNTNVWYINLLLLQALIDAWQNGLSALTHRSAYKKKIDTSFKGNAFDFITIPDDDDGSSLAYITAMIPYFATFFFDTPSNLHNFKGLIESLSGSHSHLYFCSNEQYDPDRMSRLVKKI